jgi:hypothetical protein
LQLVRQAGEVPALAGLLESDGLCEPAAQALQAIGGGGAEGAARRAIEGHRQPKSDARPGGRVRGEESS